ncbi:serine/threonine protein kinase psk1 [Mortierella claussenii]|nr:serine/threonine protein kinase psk1 [Mortierella claussenii]
MDLFSFDHDDHPNLRERTFSVDSCHGVDLTTLTLDGDRCHVPTSTPCPILSPRPVLLQAPKPVLAVPARTASTTSTTIHNAEGSARLFSPSPSSSLGVSYHQIHGNSSSKYLPAFFHQVDREQAMTPESTFRSQQQQQQHSAVMDPTALNHNTFAKKTAADGSSSTSNSNSNSNTDSESENVEYEVKIDQDFDAHAPQTTDSRGHSPRPGQLAASSILAAGSRSPTFVTANGNALVAAAAPATGAGAGGVVGLKSPSAGPRRPKHKMTPDDFKFLKVIGRGAYGKVYLVRHIATHALYAMKVLKKASIIVHAKDTECTMSERKILEAIRHPFIVKLHYAFQTDHRLYLILEYASGGELFTHLATERMFSEENTAFYAAQLVLALEHLHSLGIIYRDLKPENIMLNAHGDIVLTDFGLSKVPLEHSDGRTNTVCGTIEYMAPEVISERVHYDRTVDWWSLGIVIHDMLTGSPPFVASNRKKTMDAILNKKLNLPYYLSSDAKDLLTRLLKRTPSARLGHGPKGIENIKNHRFFRKINWKLLALRELEPPIVPFLSDPESVENFNQEFTTLPVQESPILTHGTGISIMGGGGGGGGGAGQGTGAAAGQEQDEVTRQGGGSVTPGLASGHHTPSRYMTAPSSASSAGMMNGGSTAAAAAAAGQGDDLQPYQHANGIPMVKTRSSSPDHHHFQDFSYISTSHLPSLGYLDAVGEGHVEIETEASNEH